MLFGAYDHRSKLFIVSDGHIITEPTDKGKREHMRGMRESVLAAGAEKAEPLREYAARLAARPFRAPRWLRNGHAMTMIGTQRPRRFSILRQAAERREFQTAPDGP